MKDLVFLAAFGQPAARPDSFLAVLLGSFAVLQVVFWMVVGWRAMRAHERLADATERLRHEQARLAECAEETLNRETPQSKQG